MMNNFSDALLFESRGKGVKIEHKIFSDEKVHPKVEPKLKIVNCERKHSWVWTKKMIFELRFFDACV